MPTVGFAVPVLPGKESLARAVADNLKERTTEHAESRQRGGVSVERAYLQRNPDGSAVVVAYLEVARNFAATMATLVNSDLAIDKDFLDQNKEVSGIDFRAGPAPAPELVGQWIVPGAGTRRARGFAFAAPLQPGQTQLAREFVDEAFKKRRAELTESRQAKKMTREEVFLNQTPAGDMAVVYLEGEDPVRANQEFAASTMPYDKWFKDRLKEIFPPFIDFTQPVPPNEEIFSWQKP